MARRRAGAGPWLGGSISIVALAIYLACFATPALATWLFTLLMPFTYVIFASGSYHPELFPDFFYVVFAVAALPLLTRRGRAALRGFLRLPVRPSMPGPAPAASLKEYDHATDQAQPTSGQPAR